MKKQYILTFLLASFFVVMSLHSVHADTSIAEVCGKDAVSPKCTFADFKTVSDGALSLIIKIGSAVLVLFIMYRFITAWFALQAGNAGAYKIASKQAGQAVLGFIIVVGIMGGLYLAALQFLGVKSSFLNLISQEVIPHAYATTDPSAAPVTSASPITPNASNMLPNPLGVNGLYDFILVVLKLVMSFFIYPALIIMWVWSGFQYVAAQGNPDGLKKAHQWLMWAVISTIVIFMTQGFLLALQGTVNKVLS